MIQVFAFSGQATESQRACRMATQRANAWLQEHPNSEVVSMTASQHGYIVSGETEQVYTVTLLVDVVSELLYDDPALADTGFHESVEDAESYAYETDHHWEERKAIESTWQQEY